MPVRPWIVAIVAAWILAAAAPARAGGENPVVATSYDRDVRPIFRKRCAGCHNPERARGELDLTSFAGALAGGAGGKAVVARAPEESPLYTFAAHLEEPHMPPNAARLPQRELDVLRRWIEGGLAERAADSATSPTDAAADSPAARPPGGLVPPVPYARAAAVTALAVSPTAPLAAVSGHKQILLYDLAGRKLRGALAFPEGDVFALRFSGDARTLLAAGGTGAESGHLVLFDNADWRRIATLGDELDVILAADLSPDGARVVLGGPSRVVKLLGQPRGDVLHTFHKPTDWVTGASFSPDGLLVAAGDRFGGLFLWETRSGKEFLALRGHSKAITAIAWLVEDDAMLTAGEDGRIEVWNLHTGKPVKGWDAHSGGVVSIDVLRPGRIASTGRDRRIKTWDAGGRLVADLGPTGDDATRIAWTADGRGLVSGDRAGDLRVWSPEGSSFEPLPKLVSAKSAPLAMVEPDLTPARPFMAKPVLARTPAQRTADAAPIGDDIRVALMAARDALAAAEKTFAELSRIAQASARTQRGSAEVDGAQRSVVAALDAATRGLTSLRAALAADLENPSLNRAVREAEQAVRELEQRRERGDSRSSH